MLPPAAEGTGGGGTGPRNTRSIAGLQCCLNWSGGKSRKSEPEGCGLSWCLRASVSPHLADTDPCPGGLLVFSGCPPGFLPQALALTSSWDPAPPVSFPTIRWLRVHLPLPTGSGKADPWHLPACGVSTFSFSSILHPFILFLVQSGLDPTPSLVSLFLESRFPCRLSFLFDLPSVSLMIQELLESFLFFFPVS